MSSRRLGPHQGTGYAEGTSDGIPMARLRLFANLRELAGSAEIEVDGATVGAVLEAAVSRYGEEFARSMRHAKVWLNGDPATAGDAVTAGDEVALIPPVSGGVASVRPLSGFQAVALIAAGGALVAGDLLGVAWFAAAVVGVAAVWAADLVRQALVAGPVLPLPPILASVLVGALGSYGLGEAGLGLAAAFSVASVMVWAMASDIERALEHIAPGMVVALVASLATGSLILARVDEQGRELAGAFLAMVICAGAVSWLVGRYSRVPYLDPFTAAALTAVAVALGAAFFWDLDKVALFLAGIAVAIASIGGRGLGSTVRTGEVYLVDGVPGALAMLDGPMMAAAIFLPVMRLVA